MKITLYKDCVVRDTYSRVFSPTVFEDYLATLTKTDFDIDSSYAIMGGSFSFDWGIVNAASPYVYNYMKVDDDDNDIMFYAFINRVDLANGCVVISYSNDIWHTFIGGCRMYDSLINQSKYAPTGKYHFLPIDYLTNEPVSWFSLEPAPLKYPANQSDGVVVCIELQWYETEASGKLGQRCPLIVFAEADDNAFNSIRNVELFISSFLIQQSNITSDISKQTLFSNELIPGYSRSGASLGNFEVINIFLLRKSWLVGNFTENYEANIAIFRKDVETEGAPNVPYEIKFSPLTDDPDVKVKFYFYKNRTTGRLPDVKLIQLEEYDLGNDFKMVGVGTYTNPIAAQNNGTSNKMKLYMSISSYNIYLYLNVYGQMLDITEMFKLNAPFTAINAETAQLRRLADEEKRGKAVSQIVSKSIGMVGKMISTWGGASGGTPGDTIVSKAGSTISAVGEYAGNIANAAIDIKTATAKKYQTNYGQDVESSAAINVYYGLGFFFLSNVDNQEEVDFAIDNYGYSMGVVPTTVLPYNPFNLESGYNPTCYSQINLFGSCPQGTLNQLESILRKGTKIYYSLEEVNGSTN